MASAKPKARMKDDKGKPGLKKDEVDMSILRKPIQTSITGFAQARKIFDGATEELKSLLTSECDLLYECKVCRNMFRSLANFVAHKRVYCKETFSKLIHGHFVKPPNMVSEMQKIRLVEDGYQEFLKNKTKYEPITALDRIPSSKDITEVTENLMKNEAATVKSGDTLEMQTQAIPKSAVAVFQNLTRNQESDDDMCVEVTEINKIMAKDSAVLQADGTFVSVSSPIKDVDDNVIHISDDDDVDRHQCEICKMEFTTRKTLMFHKKYKHVVNRLVYPCTDCTEVFSSSWSVLRHLYRAHRKTLTQIRRLRDVVQGRAFRMDNVPPSFIKRNNANKKPALQEVLTAEERFDQENQAWMDNMESDSELPRCGGCGRRFERRAALAAHTYTCQTRTRALARKPLAATAVPERKNVKTPTPVKSNEEDKTAKTPTKDADAEGERKESRETSPTKEMEVGENEDGGSAKPEDSGETEVADAKDSDFHEHMERNLEALRRRMAPYVSGLSCRLCRRAAQSPSHLCRHMATHLQWKRFGCKLCTHTHYDRSRIIAHANTTHKLKGGDDFHDSVIRMVAVREAEGGSVSPAVATASEDDEDSDTDEPVKQSRRKQSFRPVRKNVGRAEPEKDDEKDKPEAKKPTISPEMVRQVILGDGAATDNSKQKVDEDDWTVTDSARPAPDPTPTVEAGPPTTSRPVRKRTRPKKDEAFEYDLTNLMRMEANAYREEQTEKYKPAGVTKTANKRKSTADNSPSESSPEKQTKTEVKEEKKPDVKPKADPKPAYSGALAMASDKAASQSRAHLRPSTFSSGRLLLMHKMPVDAREQLRKLPPAARIVVKEGQRKSYSVTASASDPTKAEVRKEIIDLEKKIEDANAATASVLKAAKMRTLVAIGRQSLDAVRNESGNKNQRLVVMKRVSSVGEVKKADSTTIKVQLPRKIVSKESESNCTNGENSKDKSDDPQVQSPDTKMDMSDEGDVIIVPSTTEECLPQIVA